MPGVRVDLTPALFLFCVLSALGQFGVNLCLSQSLDAARLLIFANLFEDLQKPPSALMCLVAAGRSPGLVPAARGRYPL
jgi:hypothetical protein